jgi:hypothetical protein
MAGKDAKAQRIAPLYTPTNLTPHTTRSPLDLARFNLWR